ncbi:MAG: hypothetical protein V4584_09915 [Verrucomicrobiota bacterium]
MACLPVWAGSGAAWGHGAYHDVVTAIQAELRVHPGDAALRYKLAEAHAGHDDWRACLKQIQLVERLAPGVYPTGCLRGLALHLAGKDEEAKVIFDDFLTTNPDHVEALAARGRVLVKLGFPLAAVVDFQKAVSLTASPDSRVIVDLALALDDSGKPSEAGRAIDEGLTTSGDAPSLLECALEIETAAGLWDSALGRMEGLQKLAPRPEPWMAKRAELMTRAGRADDARAAWTVLRDRLISLPSLERGTPQNVQLLQQARKSLGETAPMPVAAPPAS